MTLEATKETNSRIVATEESSLYVDEQISGDVREVTERREVRVIREPRTYTQRSDSPSFFADLYRSLTSGDLSARERLARHSREVADEYERRDVAASSAGGLVPPIYLAEQYVQQARAGRNVANACFRAPLADYGESVVIPRGTTGLSTAPQASENTAVSATDIVESDLTIPVRTIAGRVRISRQLLERASGPALDAAVFGDLVSDYGRALDSSIINDDGTSGTHKGVIAAAGATVTFTSTTPTAASAGTKIADAVHRVGENRKMPADLILMTPRTWTWLLGQNDASNRPVFISGSVADAVAAVGGEAEAAKFAPGSLVGTFLSLPVVVDSNINATYGTGTNESRVIAVRRSDLWLLEANDGIPASITFDEALANSLESVVVGYGYAAFSAERFSGNSVAIVAGTGLATTSQTW